MKFKEEDYERSAAEDKFEEFDADNVMVIWLDLLGVRNLSHSEIVNKLDDLLNIAGRASSLGIVSSQDKKLIGTPQWLFQYCVVGDALVMTEKYDPNVANAPKLGLLKGALRISEELFAKGIPHRGVATIGKVKCKIDNRAAIITGEAVLKAYFLESSTNALGLYLSSNCESFIKWYDFYRQQNLGKALPLKLEKLGFRRYAIQKLKTLLTSTNLAYSFQGIPNQRNSLLEYCKTHRCAKKVFRTKFALKLQ